MSPYLCGCGWINCTGFACSVGVPAPAVLAVDEQAARIAQLEARVRELEEAARPFACHCPPGVRYHRDDEDDCKLRDALDRGTR